MAEFPLLFTVFQGTPGDGMSNTIDDAVSSTLRSLPNFSAERMLSSLEATEREIERDKVFTERETGIGVSTALASESSHVAGRVTGISNLQDAGTYRTRHEAATDFEEEEDFETIQHSDSGIAANYGTTTNEDEGAGKTIDASLPISKYGNQTDPLFQSSSGIDPETSGLIRQWKSSCRQKLRSDLNHVLESYPSLTSSRTSSNRLSFSNQNLDDFAWWQRKGELAVFATPTIHYPPMTYNDIESDNRNLDSSEVEEDHEEEDMMVLGSLPPGTVVKALEMVRALPPSPSALLRSAEATSTGRGREMGVSSDCSNIVFLRLEEPICGFVVYNVQQYAFLSPGTPEQYCSSNTFLWRVTCPDGAVVRSGLELTSQHVTTIPYGEIVQVTRKIINISGLSRLFVLPATFVDTSLPRESVDTKASNSHSTLDVRSTSQWKDQLSSSKGGWISQVLNPLSGQSGPIAQPLPFPVPALYKVVVEDGAVVRSGVELSSAPLGTVPKGAVLPIVGRAYSEHPTDNCLVRLQLAGGGGWISQRLNRSEPENFLVVEFIGLDPSFDVRYPAIYHLKQIRHRMKQFPDLVTSLQEDVAQFTVDPDDIESLSSSIAESHVLAAGPKGSGDPSSTTSGGGGGSKRNPAARKQPWRSKEVREEQCVICLTEIRNATIVHGGTGHIACCLTCARILKARGDKCPVCRLPIDLVIQQFWA